MPRSKSVPKKNAATRTSVRRKSYGGYYRNPSAASYRSGSYGYRRYSRPSAPLIPQFAIAQMDPFDPKARGVRVPDESTAPSSPFKLYDTTTLVGGSGGVPVANEAACGIFLPNSAQYALRQSSSSNGTTTWTWPTSWAPAGGFSAVNPSKASSVVSQYSVARPVAHGIRITCPLAPTSVTGYCHIALITLDIYGANGDDPNAMAGDGKLPTTVADMRELPHYRRVTLASLTQEPMTVVNKFLDTTAFRYVDTSSTELAAVTDTTGQPKGTFHVPQSWMAVVVAVESHGQAAGTTIVTIENITHFEGQAKVAGLNTDDSAETANPDAFDGTASAAGKTKASWFSSEQVAVASQFYQEFTNWLGQFGRRTARYATNTAARGLGASLAGYMIPRGIQGVNNVNRLNM